jgi:hypothetical protein
VSSPQPPARWPEDVRAAFWTAVNAPTHVESTTATLAFAHELAEHIREYPASGAPCCSACADAIDPEVQP